jgi:hypothetical protein
MRISATTLEAFRLFELGFKPEAELVATIQGQFTPTPRVQLGKVFGHILEHPVAHQVRDGYAACADERHCGRAGYRFEADVVDPVLARIDRRGFFEVKAFKRYGPHVVVSKADHVLGAVLSEFKTRVGRVCLERYVDSMQWRFMADTFRPTVVRYLVVELREDPIRLVDVHELPLTPDPVRVHDECRGRVEAFAAYVRRRNLAHYLPDLPEALLEGPVIEDAPTKPSAMPRLRRLREALRLRRREEEDVPLFAPIVNPELGPVAPLPLSTFALRPASAEPYRQARLF